jgi:uncharacterized protein (TIGR02328 family)
MRLWHQSLIPYLDRQRLLSQHRELCALRGKGWGKKHATVDYVFQHDQSMLVAYHFLVMNEMERRGYKPDPIWREGNYRGTILGTQENWCDPKACGGYVINSIIAKEIIYPEHDDDYLRECIENLKSKGVDTSEIESKLTFHLM